MDQMQVTVTKPIEDAVNSVPGLTTVRSTTSRGSAEVSLFFDWNVDMFHTLQLVDAALGKARQTLPTTATITTNRLTFATFPILGYSLTSDRLSQTPTLGACDLSIEAADQRVEGVSTVTIQGGKVPEFHYSAEHGADADRGCDHSRSGQLGAGVKHHRFAGALRIKSSTRAWPRRRASARCS
jgi:multidrug efflux pump subunit AcrB